MAAIALVGAGRIGLPVTRHLVNAGHPVTAYDVRPERRPDILAVGATWGEPATETDLLLTVLPGNPELRAAMLGPAGLLNRLRAGSTWVDLTSASPLIGEELAVAARDQGIAYLEAPVGGGLAAAETGAATLYVGGERRTFDRVQPILSAFASELHYTGPAGSGYLTKLLINLLWFTQVIAVSETLLLGQAGGLDPSYLRQILMTSPASSTFIADVVPSLVAGDRLATFGLDRIVEELSALEDFAGRHDIPSHLTAVVTRLHRDALERFGPIDGELLAAAHLEQLARHRISP
jgi:3-hydroxyisobutyrate dehydrogenase-like beta-hydroxyacid dehydrogenase